MFVGRVDADEGLGPLRALLATNVSPRFTTLACQMAAEVNASVGKNAVALDWVEQAADSVLLDLVWMDRCPALDALRIEPRFQSARAKVRARCQALWRG